MHFEYHGHRGTKFDNFTADQTELLVVVQNCTKSTWSKKRMAEIDIVSNYAFRVSVTEGPLPQ